MDVFIYPMPNYPPGSEPIPASDPFIHPDDQQSYRFYFRQLNYVNKLWYRWQYYPGHLYNDFVDTALHRQETTPDRAGLLNDIVYLPSPAGGSAFIENPNGPILPIRPEDPLVAFNNRYTFYAPGVLRPYDNGLLGDDVPIGLDILLRVDARGVAPYDIPVAEPDTGGALVLHTITVINWWFLLRGRHVSSFWIAPAGRRVVGLAPIVGALLVLGMMASAGASNVPLPSRRRRNT